MKTVANYYLSVFIYTLLVMTFCACDKEDSILGCEVVVNAEGPAFLKVVNDRSEGIVVDLTDIIPLSAQTRKGACEIFGLPTGSHTVTIENENGTMTKEVDFDLIKEQTYTLKVGNGFF